LIKKISRQNKGFSMVELLIVMTLMAFVLAMAAPFASSIRSDIAMRKTIRQIKTDLVTNIGYSLAGKSIKALTEGDLMNPDLIPSHYALYFKKDDDFGDPTPYKYVELRSEIESSTTQRAKVIYQVDKEMPSPVVYISDIRLKTSESGGGNSVDSAYIFFTPPFGKVVFSDNYNSLVENSSSSFDPIAAFKESVDIKGIELDFKYKDDEDSIMTLSFGADKIINIL
jgi:prepilin-type N-terminal cleavage/methylation domain-containing protein